MELREKDKHRISIFAIILTAFFIILTFTSGEVEMIGIVLIFAGIGGIFWSASLKHIRENRAWKKAPELTANVEVTNITSVVGGTSLSVSTSFHVRFDFLDLNVNQVFPLDINEKGGVIEGEQGVLTYKHLTTKKGDFVRFINFRPNQK